jgi:hypothetical protein
MNRNWMLSTTIKIVLILFLPFALSISTEGVGYACAFFNIQGILYYLVPEEYNPLITIPFSLFYLLPAIGFNYLLSHRPDDTSFTKLLGAAFVLMNPFVEIFTIMPIFSVFPFEASYSISMHATVSIMTCRWGLPILVIIPFLLHEVRKLHRIKNESEVSSPTLFQQYQSVNRYDLSVLILGILACFAPMVISIASYTYPSSALQVFMTSGIIVYQFTPVPNSSYELLSVTEMYFPIAPIVTAISIYFAYSIVKYLQNRSSKTKCFIVGLVATVVPMAVFSLEMFYPFAEISTLYPLPFTLLFGSMMLILLEPKGIASGDDFLSKSAWYDEGGVTRAEEPVKVPITHVLRSKLRKSRESQSDYDWDHETEDVFREDEQ